MQPFSYWNYDTLHAIVECGSALFEEISKGNANLSELPHTLNIYGGSIDYNNNNNNNSMFKQDDHFSYKNCYQYGSCIKIYE